MINVLAAGNGADRSRTSSARATTLADATSMTTAGLTA